MQNISINPATSILVIVLLVTIVMMIFIIYKNIKKKLQEQQLILLVNDISYELSRQDPKIQFYQFCFDEEDIHLSITKNVQQVVGNYIVWIQHHDKVIHISVTSSICSFNYFKNIRI